MAMGMGIHGEPGIWNGPVKTSRELAAESLDSITADLPLATGDEVAVLINGLGATSAEELYILFNDVAELLDEQGIRIWKTYVGEYATSMEMAGASISVCKLDEELKSLLASPCQTPFYSQV
jgi:dihydroxyacetone kinase-like protein